MLPDAESMIKLNLILPHPLAVLTPEEACACGNVDTRYETTVKRLSVEPSLREIFPYVLPDAGTGQYSTIWIEQHRPTKNAPQYTKRLKKDRDPNPLTVEQYRNIDRFEGSGRPPLTTWRSFKEGGQPLVAPSPERKPQALKESEKARIFEEKRRAGTNETAVGLADSTGRAPSRYPPVHQLRDPHEDEGVLVSFPTETDVPSAAFLPGEQVPSSPLDTIPQAPSATASRSGAPTVSVIAEEF